MNRAGNFIIKTWPAASGFKFAFGIIKRGIALPANIHARLFIVHILASERQFSAFVEDYSFFFGGQLVHCNIITQDLHPQEPFLRTLSKKHSSACWSMFEPILRTPISGFQHLNNTKIGSREQPFGVLWGVWERSRACGD